jgi:hypothetical protein
MGLFDSLLFAGRLFAGALFGAEEEDAGEPIEGKLGAVYRRRSWRPAPIDEPLPNARAKRRQGEDILFMGN